MRQNLLTEDESESTPETTKNIREYTLTSLRASNYFPQNYNHR